MHEIFEIFFSNWFYFNEGIKEYLWCVNLIVQNLHIKKIKLTGSFYIKVRFERNKITSRAFIRSWHLIQHRRYLTNRNSPSVTLHAATVRHPHNKRLQNPGPRLPKNRPRIIESPLIPKLHLTNNILPLRAPSPLPNIPLPPPILLKPLHLNHLDIWLGPLIVTKVLKMV
jgi:hypothetical protein